MRLVLNMMQLLLIASSALWHAAAAASRSSSQVVDYLPVKLKTGSSSGSTPSPSLDLLLPTRGELSITSPRDLFMTVAEPWQKLVEENQAGLVDAKQEGAVRGAGLSARVCIGCVGVGEWESGGQCGIHRANSACTDSSDVRSGRCHRACHVSLLSPPPPLLSLP
jgi:hypothetical protein